MSTGRRTAGRQECSRTKALSAAHTQKSALTHKHTFGFQSLRPLSTKNSFSMEKMLSLLFPTGSVGGDAPPTADMIG